MVGQLEWIGGIDSKTSSRSFAASVSNRAKSFMYPTDSQQAVILVKGDIIQARHVDSKSGCNFGLNARYMSQHGYQQRLKLK